MIPNLQRRYRETTSDYIRSELERYMTSRPCPTCSGKRLRPEALAVTVTDRNIDETSHMSVTAAVRWIERLAGIGEGENGRRENGRMGERENRSPLSHSPAPPLPRSKIGSAEQVPPGSPLNQREWTIARQILKELHPRMRFMVDVGLDYLTLDRMAATLSGGEAQRIRLATQIGSQLMGVLYILDEPSIGLHQRDNARLIHTLLDLRDLGNTVLVIEHDEETMRAADWIVDMGPGAGEHGG